MAPAYITNMHKQAAKCVSCWTDQVGVCFGFPPPYIEGLAITLSEAKISQTLALIYTLFFMDLSRHVLWLWCAINFVSNFHLRFSFLSTVAVAGFSLLTDWPACLTPHRWRQLAPWSATLAWSMTNTFSFGVCFTFSPNFPFFLPDDLWTSEIFCLKILTCHCLNLLN